MYATSTKKKRVRKRTFWGKKRVKTGNRWVIEAELRQMHDKTVWHGVHLQDLTKTQRRAIIRSSMFLKDKYFASGAFEKF